MIAVYQFAITFGVLLAYLSNMRWPRWPGVARVLRIGHLAVSSSSTKCWRGMLLAGLVPAVILFGLLLFVPESPRWLTKQGLSAAALGILTRVNGPEAARRE